MLGKINLSPFLLIQEDNNFNTKNNQKIMAVTQEKLIRFLIEFEDRLSDYA